MIRVATIDDRLHTERVGPDRTKRTFRARLDGLPDGVFVAVDGMDRATYLIWEGGLLAWSPSGYQRWQPPSRVEVVSVLTPRSTVSVLLAGYKPGVHASASQPCTRQRSTFR